MKLSNHSQWLSISKQGFETALLESNRLRSLLRSVADPDEVEPSLYVFIGARTKSIALEKAFGIRRRKIFKSKQYAGDVDLHMASSSEQSTRPLLVADASLNTRGFRYHTTGHGCQEINRWPLRNSESYSPDGLEQALLSRLLLPFTDVICFFASDLGGFPTIARHLAGWLRSKTVSTAPPLTKPTVMIVTDKMPTTAQREQEAKKAFLWLLKEQSADNLFDLISDLDVVAIHPPRTFGPSPNWNRLKGRLLRASNRARKHRVESHTLYSMTHLVAFIEAACKHFSESATEPFNFIQASRLRNPAALDLKKHLANLFGHCATPEDVISFAAPVIASSFLLDSYPPDCHVFDPRHIFREMYYEAVNDALGERVISFESSSKVILRTGVLKEIQTHLLEYFERLTSSPDSSSALIHLTNIQRHKDRWSQIYSEVTCFCCTSRTPQYRFPCGHLVCETCVQIFGKVTPSEPWTYRVNCCFLCGEEWTMEVIVTVKAPTRGVSILCLDGGGTRAIIPLTLMKRIQERTGLPIPIQKYFKLVAGVSSGSITALAMYHKGWPLDKCIQSFLKLAKSSFKQENTLGIPFISWVAKLFRLYARDGLYKPENLESILQNLLGQETRMLDCSYATQLGAKICVLVATVLKKPSCRIFANYMRPNENHGKRMLYIVSAVAGANVPLWEIFFPTKHIPKVGTFQDIGLLSNDPVATAFSEAAMLYPSTPTDLILSLGTGKVPKVEYDQLCEVAAPPARAAFRIRDLVWEKSRDQQVRQVFAHHPRYHRLDHEVDQDYGLDDVNHMLKLKSDVEHDTSLSESIDRVAWCAVASLFYFELVDLPMRDNGKDAEFKILLSQLTSCRAQFYINGEPLPVDWSDSRSLDGYGNFCRKVTLETAEQISIILRMGDTSAETYISGLPSTINNIIEAQGLNAYFGTQDHRKRKRPVDSKFHSGKRRRMSDGARKYRTRL
ncbi:uncharacterized protein Z519_12728 [Cladophialophora bantiana CBS 173.52]|uniref:PNPLA domain-containing protein n=1 Tax=Cladophialophora bantiana (strain ATCC 10958 / CBS 173.52 / CDC B-1940 / NIH 8579) TaxID=1442370 RepID=A0A0D2H062_CLAB1|nr:uncharacterized protein Z519_12728 [Cladophialophora bantiana CBS 173.52]KIW86673.1 hypothetical protein Z519_12728 [Cladophialophora bantiana CBS 173.52]